LKIEELIYNFATLKELGWSTTSITYFVIVDVQVSPKNGTMGGHPTCPTLEQIWKEIILE
jgi:hypothetical protein